MIFTGAAKENRATAVDFSKNIHTKTKSEKLGKLSGEAWRTIVKAGLRVVMASVKNRRELIAIILVAATSGSVVRIPIGWIKLAFD